ncbi:hypothetical protein PIB30_075141, partial [Stylosanthes scabra]|nr:hypothetical protein [Stylosanthes scabra]
NGAELPKVVSGNARQTVDNQHRVEEKEKGSTSWTRKPCTSLYRAKQDQVPKYIGKAQHRMATDKALRKHINSIPAKVMEGGAESTCFKGERKPAIYRMHRIN